MGDLLFYLLIAIVVAAGGVLVAALARGFLVQPASSTKPLFGPRPEKRLAVVDQSNIDGRRKLVLVRRDQTEHLIMIGGPVDIVVETGIRSGEPAEPRRPEAANGGFNRASRRIEPT